MVILDSTVRELIQKLGEPMAIELYKSYISGKLFDEKRPFYSDPQDLVKLVLPNELDYTSTNDGQPILATFGIYTCIAVAGYDEENKVGFLTHIDETDDSGSGLEMIHSDLSDNYPNYHMDVRIIGGTSPNSKPFVEEVVNSISAISSWNIIERDVLGPPLIRSFALDTRDGKTYGYRRTQNI